jgi:hypothetical protein
VKTPHFFNKPNVGIIPIGQTIKEKQAGMAMDFQADINTCLCGSYSVATFIFLSSALSGISPMLEKSNTQPLSVLMKWNT